MGGLVGDNSHGGITGRHAIVSISGDGSVGGLAGSSDGSIVAGYAMGSVSGIYYGIGGLVGDNKGTISASYTTASVFGTTASVGLGGLVGSNDGTIIASYVAASVSGGSRVGGFVGVNGGSVTASYWDTETSEQSAGVGEGSEDGVEGKTTEELQLPTDYDDIYEKWHIDLHNADGDDDETTGRDDVWDFGTSSEYPALKVDTNGDGTATWWEGSEQHNSATPTPTNTASPTLTAIPTSTPTPTATNPQSTEGEVVRGPLKRRKGAPVNLG